MAQNEAPAADRIWQVRAYAPGDTSQVAELYQEVYGRALDVAFYRWKLHTLSAAGGVANVWLADGGEAGLVGHYGGTPRRFWLQGHMLGVRHTSDAMTSPRFRKEGVYSAVGTAAHNAWAAAGEEFLFGLPNDKWGSRVAYLNYQRMFPAVWLRRPLRPELPLARRLGLPVGLLAPLAVSNRALQSYWNHPLRRMQPDLQVERVERPGPEFDQLWEQLKERYEALVVRDRAWVTYRYCGVPGCDYRLLLAQRGGEPAGYLAYRLTAGEHGHSGWIMDLFTAPDDRPGRAGLLLAALQALAQEGAGSVRILLPPGTPLYEQVRQAGFVPAPGGFGCHIVPLAWPTPPAVFTDPNGWFTMAGDYDII